MIYCVEDDGSISDLIIYTLNSAGFEAKGFECGKDFFDALGKETPRLILLDIMLPDEDGITVLEKLRSDRETRKLPVIMVTAKTTEIDKVKGLDSGADDYITKPFGVMELISRVKSLLRRAEPDSEGMPLRLAGIVLDMVSRSCKVEGKTIELTYKEFELLALLIQNKGIVLSRDILMEKVWGIDFAGESRTLDVHIKTLRKKLEDAGRHIQTVRNVGYLAEEESKK